MNGAGKAKFTDLPEAYEYSMRDAIFEDPYTGWCPLLE